MKGFLGTLMLLLITCAPVRADEAVVAGLSQDRVEITANYDGSDILIYGAVKRDAPIPTDSELDVIITVEGPGQEQEVRRKSRLFGLWINSQTVTVDVAPSFYAVATTRPFEDIISHTEDLRQRISIPQAIKSIGAPSDVSNAQDFVTALIRLRSADGLYAEKDGSVELTQDTLFRTNVDLPANLVEGNYKTRIFLLRNKALVNLYEKTIYVRKVGLERWLYNLAHQQPAAYGLLALVVAALAGWAASAAFTLIRR